MGRGSRGGAGEELGRCMVLVLEWKERKEAAGQPDGGGLWEEKGVEECLDVPVGDRRDCVFRFFLFILFTFFR